MCTCRRTTRSRRNHTTKWWGSTCWVTDCRCGDDLRRTSGWRRRASWRRSSTQYRDESERERRLSAPVFEAMRERRLLSMLVSKAFGGSQVSLETAVRAVELVSQFDGAAGWNLVIGCGGALMADYLPEEHVPVVFGDWTIAGSFGANGQAIPVEGGYRVSGRWGFASGCHSASFLGGRLSGHRGRQATHETGRTARHPDHDDACRQTARSSRRGTRRGCAAPAAMTSRRRTCSCRRAAMFRSWTCVCLRRSARQPGLRELVFRRAEPVALRRIAGHCARRHRVVP